LIDSSNAPQGTERPGPIARFRRFTAARFDPKTYLGLHLTVGLVVGALGVWLFSALLDAVLDNETLVRWDVASDAWIHSHVTQQGLAIFDWITRAGSPLSMTVLGVVVGVLLLWQRRRTILIPWIAALAGGGILDDVIKQLVHRTRPVYGAAYLTGHSYSFPSGHAMGSIIALGMLLYVLGLYWHPSRLVRISSIIVACIFVVLVGVSRVYLGVHYPSDVMGGWAAGAAWVAVCVSGASFALHRYEPV